MKSFYNGVERFLKDEDGVTAIEYALIAALIAVVIIAAVASVGTRLTCTFSRVAGCLLDPNGATCTAACP